MNTNEIETYCTRRSRELRKENRKLAEAFTSIANRATQYRYAGRDDMMNWLNEALDPDNNEPGSSLFIAVTEVLENVK